MGEDITKTLTDTEKLDLILIKLSSLEYIMLDIKEMLATLAYDDLQMRASQSRLSSRVTDLENRMTGD